MKSVAEESSGASLIISAPCAEADVSKHGIVEVEPSGTRYVQALLSLVEINQDCSSWLDLDVADASSLMP